jgi:hypothetical protein
MQDLQEVTNGAKYVEWYNNHVFAVWLGGHTVNFYHLMPNSHEVEPTTCINVGDFSKNQVELTEVKDGIEKHFKQKAELGH